MSDSPSAFRMTFLQKNQTDECTVSDHESLLSVIRRNGLPVSAPCGGNGTCGKCLVSVTGPVRELSTGLIHEATNEDLLSCRYAAAGNVTIRLGAHENLAVLRTGVSIPEKYIDKTKSLVENGDASDLADAEARASGDFSAHYGAAVDIGTTTVAAFLYDLSGGKFLESSGARNAQHAFGADVISRIQACEKGQEEELTGLIRKQISGLIRELCQDNTLDFSTLSVVSIAGNTVMLHLLAGLDPSGIGRAPFTPVSLFGENFHADPSWLSLPETAKLYLCPCLSGYVGGDISAGLLFAEQTVSLSDGLSLFMDIGTNGEMALGNNGHYLTAATAAGPAFEGANISCGMAAGPGAIDRVDVVNGELVVHVLEDEDGRTVPAYGLCGSGLCDAVAALLELGVITESGRFEDADELPPSLASRFISGPEGRPAFLLSGNVFLSSQDIREVQLAKAAIRAGAETLLASSGLSAADLSSLVIAGGFGSYLRTESALKIGLFPQLPAEKVKNIGNAAGAGAALALTEKGREDIDGLIRRCSYLELSSSHTFRNYYTEYLSFDE